MSSTGAEALVDRITILDCTLRDGSYSVDFKFTAFDTAALTGQLAALGIDWIEIGHGFGLGAAEAGKGDMPATDTELIQAAKACAGAAKVGMVFNPTLAGRDHLERARDAGLDFVRIVGNAPEAEQTYPYLAHAKKLGLIASLNMMKSYAVTPAEFAEKARGARAVGADLVYCVDSVGCMLPDDVARHIDAAKNAVDCPLGFHGHNGLMMAVANSVRAYQHGARFLDATLCGLGRGGGNAPTETLVAVLGRMGVATTVDFLKIVQLAQNYVRPLMRGNDMGATLDLVGARYRFHSSYLPAVKKIAEKHHVDLHRLIAEAGLHDPVRLDLAHLESAARALAEAGVTPPDLPYDALRKSDDRVLATVPSNDPAALTRALVDRLGVMRAKRHGSEVALFISPARDDDPTAAGFVLADEQLVLGRMTYGSLDALSTIVSTALAEVSLFLVDVGIQAGMDGPATVVKLAGARRVVPVHWHELQTIYLREVIDRFLPAAGPDVSVSALLYRPTPVVRDAAVGLDLGPDGLVCIERVDADAVPARSGFALILCGAEPDCEDAPRLASLLAPTGTILIVGNGTHRQNSDPAGTIRLNLDLAFCGILERHREQSENGARASTND